MQMLESNVRSAKSAGGRLVGDWHKDVPLRRILFRNINFIWPHCYSQINHCKIGSLEGVHTSHNYS